MIPTEAPLDAANEQQSVAPDYGPNFRNLPDQLKEAILSVVRDLQQQEKYLRRQELLQDAQHRFYDMGVQHIWQGRDNCWMQATPGASFTDADGISDDWSDYIDDYDIFHPFALIQVAKLSENMPGIDFQPLDPNNPDDLEAATAAEGMRHEFDRNNDVKEIQKSIIYHLQMGGRALLWTHKSDSEEDFDDAGPKEGVTAKVYGCVEHKVPIFANSQKEYWYAIIYDDPDIRRAKTKYPWIAKKIAAGETCLSENEYERITRLGVLQGAQGSAYGFRIGDSIAHLVSRGNVWLRLEAFQACDEAFVDEDGQTVMVEVKDDDGEPITRAQNVKEKLAEVFPDGVHAVIVGKQYAESWNESMDDRLSVAHAYVGKGQSRMPMMKSMVVVQDRFNSAMNYSAENFDYGAPSTWVSASTTEYAAITKQKSQPWAFRQMKELGAGEKLSDRIYREGSPDLPLTFQKYLEFIYGALPQFQLAVPPSIWGEAMKDQQTSSGYQLAASQAMGILGVYWMVETQMLAKMYYHNCLVIKNDENYPDQLTVPVPGAKSMIVRKASLNKGNFRCYPDTDSGFPETTIAKRTTLAGVTTQLAQSPLALQIFGSPDNISFMLREYGLTEMVIPEALSREKQLREIETLLSQSPKLPPPLAAMLQAGLPVPDILQAGKALAAMMDQEAMINHAAQTIAATAKGGPPPPPPVPVDPSQLMKSSVPVWESDYHTWEGKKCRDWLSSDERHTEESIGRPDPMTGELKPNMAGILNVFLHMKGHDAFALMEPPNPMVTGVMPAPNVASVPKPLPPPTPQQPGAAPVPQATM